uniref:Uncharacterized protein n=1 Tax=Chromera velia CCMP2878 TaxID=1169474 RepID=A0A0K6S9T9_9ALVE|eukprot:Cvel_8736.t1-p1 / transcript=Cvel_8736.t1 / gene=Cvel_8736 / organism=Chromera_velia_CCMP2878 / gene_product=hypothetical protein / transcript_product=hypothetical protein / location=Cvel_scaffold488:79561-82185(-) / protein_length=138 / sequence_SO=supercontig / SO=protein_coding / is_pseudo=false
MTTAGGTETPKVKMEDVPSSSSSSPALESATTGQEQVETQHGEGDETVERPQKRVKVEAEDCNANSPCYPFHAFGTCGGRAFGCTRSHDELDLGAQLKFVGQHADRLKELTRANMEEQEKRWWFPILIMALTCRYRVS